jgi:hypothetical protein
MAPNPVLTVVLRRSPPGTVAPVPRIHRYSNFAAFIGTGAVLGFAIGSGLAMFGDSVRGYSRGTTVAFVGLLGACILATVAAVLAVLLDRRG